jgi:hypothetical protein
MTADSSFTNEIKQVLTVLDDPVYSSVAFARSLVKQVEGMTFPSGHLLAMQLELHDFLNQVRLYGNVGAGRLRHAALQLLSRAQGLERPVPASQPGDDCAPQIAAALNALDDSAVTAEAFARQGLNKIAGMTFPSERIPAVRDELRAYEKQLLALLAADDAAALRCSMILLLRYAQDLARPITALSSHEVVRGIFVGLQNAGWASATIDVLPQELEDGEKVLRYDADSLTTDKRKIDRLEFIEKMRPGSWTIKETWRTMHTRDAALYLRPAPDSER